MRDRLSHAFERFIDVRERSDAEIADLLRELEVDIAVDLAGFTGAARTGIFALRPAPVQVNFLGYTGTMGAPYFDYIVADEMVIPEEQRVHYAEKVVYLPDVFQVNDARRRIAESTPARSDVGLAEGAFVFCSFNNSFKIAPPVFERWMRLLRDVDGSVLWLLDGGPEVSANLRREAQARGVDPERLVFARKVPHEDHLARHRLADLFLDTLPFNAHTTASDALWAGLPVVTCLGTTFAGRVAASLLQAVGLPELITHSLDEYEAMALRLARDPPSLATIKGKLANQRTTFPLFDTDRFRRHLEAAYVAMWERYQRGEVSVAFEVARNA
jgi:predicted O-linked N-acetylglucosamine transferase (SPINDLY family)